MKSRLLWSLVAGVLIVAGFVVDKTILDDDDGGGDEAAEQTDETPDTPDSDTTDTGPADSPSDTGDSNDDGDYQTYSGLPTITLDELPSEAIDVLTLIEDGGPYEYSQDDSVFQNREGILPDRESGHYREYTVETPGSPDRGARRIVAGADGERYWTDDHYDSFFEIVF